MITDLELVRHEPTRRRTARVRLQNKLAFGCTVTWMVHLALIGVGLIPWPAGVELRTECGASRVARRA